jgi:hypothetical protein
LSHFTFTDLAIWGEKLRLQLLPSIEAIFADCISRMFTFVPSRFRRFGICIGFEREIDLFQLFVKQVFDFLSTKISLRTSTGQKSMSSYFGDLIQDHMQLQLASTTPEVIGEKFVVETKTMDFFI